MGPKTSKLIRDFGQLQTLIAIISTMDQDIDNRKTTLSAAILSKFCEKMVTSKNVYMFSHLKSTLRVQRTISLDLWPFQRLLSIRRFN